MKIIIAFTLLCFSTFVQAQKPGIEQAYKFKETPKISLKSLRIPTTAGGHIFLGLSDEVKSQDQASKNRGPAAAKSFGSHQQGMISLSGACTLQSGSIVSPGDAGYETCLDGSVYVKKVILTDPTQSILMNVNLDGINFNPFE